MNKNNNIPVITAQKTCIEDGKRNSILKYLDDIGFDLILNKSSDSVLIKDGDFTYAKIQGIKGLEDWITENSSIGPILGGSDFIGEFQAITNNNISKILETPVGKADFKVLTTEKIRKIEDLESFSFYSKFPNFSEKILSSAGIFDKDRKERVAMQEAIDNGVEFVGIVDEMKKVKKSGGADNLISRMKKRNSAGKFAAMELIETGETAKNLGLCVGDFPELNLPVSTNFYLKDGVYLNNGESGRLNDLIYEIRSYFESKKFS